MRFSYFDFDLYLLLEIFTCFLLCKFGNIAITSVRVYMLLIFFPTFFLHFYVLSVLGVSNLHWHPCLPLPSLTSSSRLCLSTPARYFLKDWTSTALSGVSLRSVRVWEKVPTVHRTHRLTSTVHIVWSVSLINCNR